MNPHLAVIEKDLFVYW